MYWTSEETQFHALNSLIQCSVFDKMPLAISSKISGRNRSFSVYQRTFNRPNILSGLGFSFCDRYKGERSIRAVKYEVSIRCVGIRISCSKGSSPSGMPPTIDENPDSKLVELWRVFFQFNLFETASINSRSFETKLFFKVLDNKHVRHSPNFLCSKT